MKHPINEYPDFLTGTEEDSIADIDYDAEKRTITIVIQVDLNEYDGLPQESNIVSLLAPNEKAPYPNNLYAKIIFYDVDILSSHFFEILNHENETGWYNWIWSVSFIDGAPIFDLDPEDWSKDERIKFRASSFEYLSSKQPAETKRKGFKVNKIQSQDLEWPTFSFTLFKDFMPEPTWSTITAFSYNTDKETITMVVSQNWRYISKKAASVLDRPDKEGRWVEAKIRYCFHHVVMLSKESQKVFEEWEKRGWQIDIFSSEFKNGVYTFTPKPIIYALNNPSISFTAETFEYGLVF
ncbi:MAG: hypothetical protein LKJ88_04385 [Bacilli bacterium]|nr:hypothetical protein [Bacilli bacterium]